MIVVGVDGSPTGLLSVDWAAKEAVLRGVPLTVAHVVPDWVCHPLPGRYAEVGKWMRDGAREILADAERQAREQGAEVTTELVPGDPRAALIKTAEEAELLVVGSRGLGGVRGLLLGSVAHGVAAHAPIDVVLVRDPPAVPRGEIVAGVDGSEGGRRALEFAFAEAELRGARLRAVQAWAWPRPSGFEPADPEAEREAREALRLNLLVPRQCHPSVEVIEDVVHGHPVEVLREAASGADLLVVGTRGQGTLKGMIMGSVSQAMLHHAPCPMAIVKVTSS
ncbi:universal stress protein [Nonomuraea spiralis]|uniref:Universal stress protein n=1 Tax=Nonomuraea spiralis TaxID=46182 RepID=A0ABV5IID1_9ACTN|nr:universal stress protein [Nonomuraea spiralis]GGS96951.1 universal stress protein [Nonomuraea spiralis]